MSRLLEAPQLIRGNAIVTEFKIFSFYVVVEFSPVSKLVLACQRRYISNWPTYISFQVPEIPVLDYGLEVIISDQCGLTITRKANIAAIMEPFESTWMVDQGLKRFPLCPSLNAISPFSQHSILFWASDNHSW
jgi:hypothetical protein